MAIGTLCTTLWYYLASFTNLKAVWVSANVCCTVVHSRWDGHIDTVMWRIFRSNMSLLHVNDSETVGTIRRLERPGTDAAGDPGSPSQLLSGSEDHSLVPRVYFSVADPPPPPTPPGPPPPGPNWLTESRLSHRPLSLSVSLCLSWTMTWVVMMWGFMFSDIGLTY